MPPGNHNNAPETPIDMAIRYQVSRAIEERQLMTRQAVEELMEKAAEKAAEKAVSKVFYMLGIDVNNVEEINRIREDRIFLRELRLGSRDTKIWVRRICLVVFASAMLFLVAKAFHEGMPAPKLPGIGG